MNLTIVCGTDRRHSVSRQVCDRIAELHRQRGATVRILDPAEMPASAWGPDSYHEGNKAGVDSWVKTLASTDGAVVVVPEYNGSSPGVIKHVFDLFSDRDHVVNGLPVCFVGVAAGDFGGLRAVDHLSEYFIYRRAFLFPDRVYLREVEDSLDNFGWPRDSESSARLLVQAERFSSFVSALLGLRGLFIRGCGPG